MAREKISSMDGFELGAPALVCRWRIANRKLPLVDRHLRALLARKVQGTPVSKELAAWAKQHIEWTLDKGALAHPDGVLMLIVDGEGRAAMTVGPYESLEDTRLQGLMHRAARSANEARSTLVAPETLWVACGDRLLWDGGEGCAASGAASLIAQLALTMGIDVQSHSGLMDAIETGAVSYDEAFLVSDEHGVVVASDAAGRHGKGMAEGYQRLLKQA